MSEFISFWSSINLSSYLFINSFISSSNIFFSTNKKHLLTNEQLKKYEDYDSSHSTCFGSIFINNNNKKDSETNINNLKKNYTIKIKDLTKENNKLKIKNEELISKIEENEEMIRGLEDKNKILVEQINEVNQKYNIFIMNDEKKIFEEDIKELIKRYNYCVF